MPDAPPKPPFGATQRRPGLLGAILAGFVLLAGACVFAGILAWRDFQATDAVVEARQARRAGTLILTAVLDAETGQRGFLLMREPGYLAAYNDAKTDFEKSLAELRRRSTDNAWRTAQVIAVTRIGEAKFSELDRTIALGKAGQFEGAIAIVRAGTGKVLMDELRHIVDVLTDRANEDVAQTTAAERSLSILLVGAIIIALACVAALSALLLIDARYHFGLLETREANARQLAETLEWQVALRTRELAEVNQRFDAALRASGITVASQDRDLVFTWASRGAYGRPPEDVVGRSQQDITPGAALGAVLDLKRGVIETGEPAQGDIRAVHDGVETWYHLTVHPVTDERGVVTGIIACAVDVSRFKEQEARIRLLMRELTHRSKNLLAVIQAIMRQTASQSVSLADFESRFSARVQSLSGSHDLLVREDWQGASLGDLIRSQLGHYIDQVGSQVELSGDPVQVGPDAAQHIGMALHELATNAAKYGALSVPDGKIRISWQVTPTPDRGPTCEVHWEESGGPPVARPARRGFGRVVIERTVARALHGEVRIDYAPSGLQWMLVFPLALRQEI